jgi:hypothetical protein
MTTTINADNGAVSGSAGLKYSSDSSGVLALQTNGTTAVSISTAQVVTLTNALAEASGGTGTTTGYYGFKNRIINGAMVIDQRNAGASVTPTDGQYTLDRWVFAVGQTSKLTTQQNAGAVTPPTGFSNYLGITSSSAYTLLAGDYFTVAQRIEGFNFADMAWGTASAATVTLSFWVRSSLTGTFGGTLNNNVYNRNYPFTYTILLANTWEQKSVTVAGDTSGTWVGATNGTGLSIQFSLGMGSTYSGTSGAWTSSVIFAPTGATSVVGTNGATFYITGVQLEKGSTATSFDYRPYGTELALCQRYLPAFTNGGTNSYIAPVFIYSSTGGVATIPFQVTARVRPTGVTINNLDLMVDGVGNYNATAAVYATSSPTSGCLNLTISGATAGQAGALLCEGTTNILFTGCEL